MIRTKSFVLSANSMTNLFTISGGNVTLNGVSSTMTNDFLTDPTKKGGVSIKGICLVTPANGLISAPDVVGDAAYNNALQVYIRVLQGATVIQDDFFDIPAVNSYISCDAPIFKRAQTGYQYQIGIRGKAKIPVGVTIPDGSYGGHVQLMIEEPSE